MSNSLDQEALDYHAVGRPGKLALRATKPMATARDLSLAYSPGVAAACTAIEHDPADAARYTARANLVAVISNGTAVLGLGDIGALASKPVMEGKAVLFKKFADIDVFDIEIDEKDPEKLIETVRRLEPTFGAINLEDIKAPECFEVEARLRETMGIPVFHDDQHGTAVVAAAAALNALRIAGKRFEDLRIVSVGGGAAGIACLNLMVTMGARRENIYLCDRGGLVVTSRTDLNPEKAIYALDHPPATLDDVIDGADLFLGLAGPGVLSAAMVARMAGTPIIMAMANPTPEIMPEEARAVRPDAIIATGRSDYPNQVNNVLCFPYIFRGALDCGATTINEEMKAACVRAIADLAHAETADEVARAYRGENLTFGPDYILPKPFDPRLLVEVSIAVARAAIDSGVAARPITDFAAYRERLTRMVYRSGFLMKPFFERARANGRRVVFAEGEDERVIRAALACRQDGLAAPLLIGAPGRIARICAERSINATPGETFGVIDPADQKHATDLSDAYRCGLGRDGVGPAQARKILSTNETAIAAMMVREGEADAMICGTSGQYLWHHKHVSRALGGAGRLTAALSALILDKGVVFIADPYVNYDPGAEDLAEIAVLAAQEVRQFGLEPRVAFVSHANFGADPTPSARKMRAAVAALAGRGVDFEFEGEMRSNLAFKRDLREKYLPEQRLSDSANILIFPGIDAANGAMNVLKALAEAQPVGPLLLGMDRRAVIVTPTATVRGLLNAVALVGGGK
jgi:malate dehydrogenase (oxaloacetate-decarboxylating)(NADP+)